VDRIRSLGELAMFKLFARGICLLLIGVGGFSVTQTLVGAQRAQLLPQLGVGPIRSVSFSPDGRFILSAGDSRYARLWDAVTGQQIRLYGGLVGEINHAAFSPDGLSVLTANDDSTARIWDAGTGKQALIFRGHAGPVLSATFLRMAAWLQPLAMTRQSGYGVPPPARR
jgi:WD40 repeat protein